MTFCDICGQVRPIGLVIVCQSPDLLLVNRVCTRCLLEGKASERVVQDTIDGAVQYAEEVEGIESEAAEEEEGEEP